MILARLPLLKPQWWLKPFFEPLNHQRVKSVVLEGNFVWPFLSFVSHALERWWLGPGQKGDLEVAGLSGTPGNQPVGCNEKAWKIFIPPKVQARASRYIYIYILYEWYCMCIYTPMFIYIYVCVYTIDLFRIAFAMEEFQPVGGCAKEGAWRFFPLTGEWYSPVETGGF